MAIVFSAKLNSVEGAEIYSPDSYYTGYAIFWSGVTVGMCNLLCGVAVGINGSSAALADAADSTLYVPFRGFRPFLGLLLMELARRFVKILVIEIFSSVLGLFGLIVGLLLSSKALDFGSKA